MSSMHPLHPSTLDKFLPLLPSSRRTLQRLRKEDKEFELIQDTNELMDVILPVCLSRPNVYFLLSETLSKWILRIESIDDESDLDTVLSSIQTYDDDESIMSMASNNNVSPIRQQPRYSVSFATPQIDEEKEERAYPTMRQQRTQQHSSGDNSDSWALIRQSQRRLTSTRSSLADDLEKFAEMYGSDFDDSIDEEDEHSNSTIEEEERDSDDDGSLCSTSEDALERAAQLNSAFDVNFSPSRSQNNNYHDKNVDRKQCRRLDFRKEDQELYDLLQKSKRRLSIVPTNENKEETTSKLCDFYDVDDSTKAFTRRKSSKIITNLPFLKNKEKKDSSRAQAKQNEEKIKKKNIAISKSGRFLSQQQMEDLASSHNTIEELKVDIRFVRNELWNVAAEKCTRRRVRDTINTLLHQLESDTRIYNSIRRSKDQRFQNEWNSHKDLFLQLLDYIEARIILVKQGTNHNSRSSFYEHITGESKTADEGYHPYAHVYNQVLSQYLAHTRTSSKENEQSNHYRWKRPERPTSDIRQKDVEMVEELLSVIASSEAQQHQKHQQQEYSSNFDAASTRVLAVLKSIHEDCMTDVQRLKEIEIEEQRKAQREEERQRAKRRFKKRSTRASFATLSINAKQQLLGEKVLVDALTDF